MAQDNSAYMDKKTKDYGPGTGGNPPVNTDNGSWNGQGTWDNTQQPWFQALPKDQQDNIKKYWANQQYTSIDTPGGQATLNTTKGAAPTPFVVDSGDGKPQMWTPAAGGGYTPSLYQMTQGGGNGQGPMQPAKIAAPPAATPPLQGGGNPAGSAFQATGTPPNPIQIPDQYRGAASGATPASIPPQYTNSASVPGYTGGVPDQYRGALPPQSLVPPKPPIQDWTPEQIAVLNGTLGKLNLKNNHQGGQRSKWRTQ